MRQEINLYQDSLRDKKIPLSAGAMVFIVGLTLMAMLVILVGMRWQQKNLFAELAVLKAQHTKLSSEVQMFKTNTPPRSKNPQLEVELAQLRLELAGRKPLLDYFANTDSAPAHGFSPLLEGLARYPFDGVWLTQITLNTLKKQVNLAGSATRAELVPAYLRYLGEKQVFIGQSFASMKLTRLKENLHQVDFRLETEFGASDGH
ncbi:PilN domain-containing protein [Geopsychrobacter electrodiphilus]|uniref:PilN domain-containing protein n=1 Tax=Geopsychrobacter electrodiphilus TaxID=225196 RepID=UPI00037ACC49|nr:PilN domain-containing protein [Geopsychrobacter electrodiphilus]